MSNECAARDSTHELSQRIDKLLAAFIRARACLFLTSLLADLEKALEVNLHNLLLPKQVAGQCLPCE